jgi:isopropylmalate/homocitrate/citramalate synthase
MTVSDSIELTDVDRNALSTAKLLIEDRFELLRNVVPSILDLSCRECALPASYGHTLEDKKALFKLVREFGFPDLMVSNFFDFPNTDVQFVRYLASEKVNMDGMFSFVSEVSDTEDGKPITPNNSMSIIFETGIPNVTFDLFLNPSYLVEIGRSPEQTLRDIERSILFMREKLPEKSASRGRIYVNIADFFNVLDEDEDFLLRALKLFEAMPIDGLLFEDTRGTHFHFQTFEIVKFLRRYVPSPRKILVHPHAGNGLEDATLIDAILGGADGTWAAFTPHAAQIGHGSSLMLITNLMRAGNLHLEDAYNLSKLMSTAERMWKIHTRDEIEPNQPVVGSRAYKYIDRGFEQGGRPCDLPPEVIGITPSWRMTPGWSPPYTIARRLEELGYSSSIVDDENLLKTIRCVMSDANMDGQHVKFEEPAEIADTVASAQKRLNDKR